MDQLRGVDSLDVVYKRFSDGVEVVRCVLEFCKVVGDVEQSYSNSMHKLLKSSSYTLHSNIIVQWLGGEPFLEIGTLKHCWQEIGGELSCLAKLHSEKATAYLETVRKPLIDLIPQLEDTRKELKAKMQTLRINLEIAEKKFSREKQKYTQLGDNYGRLKEKLNNTHDTRSGLYAPKNMLESKLGSMRRDLELQECVYKDAHTQFHLAQDQFNEELSELYKMIHEKEMERVKTVKKVLQEFARTLSNTAPAYLESMQKIVFSVDEIDGYKDIEHFVKDHQTLLECPTIPDFTIHQSREEDEGSYSAAVRVSPERAASPELNISLLHENGSLHNGDRTPPASTREKVLFPPERFQDDQQPMDAGVSEGTPTQSAKPNSRLPPSSKKPAQSEQARAQEAKPKPLMKPTVSSQKPTRHNDNLIKGSSSSATGSSSSSTNYTSYSSTSSSSRAASTSSSVTSSQGSSRDQKPHPTKSRPSDERSTSAKPPTKPRSKPPQESKPPISSKDSPNLDALLRPRRKPVPTSSLPPQPINPRPPRPTRQNQNSLAPAHPAKSLNLRSVDEQGDPREFKLLSRLRETAGRNDYYEVLGVAADASSEDIAKARREKSKEFHPDHYGNDPERRAKAEETLRQINQIFQDVMKTKEKRALYDQLCRFRTMYPKIIHQPISGLEAAQGKLANLQKAMKKAQLPLEVQDEIGIALNLIKTRIDNLSKER